MASLGIRAELQKYSNSNYSELFDTAFLVYNGKSWEVTDSSPSDMQLYYSTLARQIISLIPLIPKQDAFIRRFNTAATLASEKKPANPLREHPILFNSKAAFRFLSNFFPTLIPFHGKIYRSSENAYQVHKVMNLNAEASTEELAVAEPVDSKILAQILCPHEALTDQTAIFKYNLMKEIVREKFSYNPVLKSWLLSTAPHLLIEESSDRFWGIPKGKIDYSVLKKNLVRPVDKSSINILGRILFELRDEFSK